MKRAVSLRLDETLLAEVEEERAADFRPTLTNAVEALLREALEARRVIRKCAKLGETVRVGSRRKN
jgi:hypothetical protein